MENATAGKILPTAIIGSLPAPSWFSQRSHGLPFRLAMSDAVYHEQYTDAVSSLIRDQERAGIEIMTDGDSRLDVTVGGSSWALYPAERLSGVAAAREMRQKSTWDQPEDATRADAGAGTIFREIDESAYSAVVIDKVSKGDLEYTPIWQAAQRLTSQPIKFGTPSAEVIYQNLIDRFYGESKELVMDVAAALNEELADLASAGCQAIQIEAPWITRAFARSSDDIWTPEFYAEIFERTVRGLSDQTEVWAHLCWGNSAGQQKNLEVPSYGPAMEILNEISCDVITFENADSHDKYLTEICKGIESKKVALGIVSHRTLQMEQPSEIAASLRRALEYIPPERLLATADCGFGREGMSRRIALYKMVSMVRGTNLVRSELGLEPQRSLAADPRFSFMHSAADEASTGG